MRTKDLHIALKTNNPAEELMKRFDFSTREELYEAIRKISPQAAKDFIRKIERKSKHSDSKVEVVVVEIAEETQEDSAILMANDEAEEEVNVMSSGETRESELQQLQRDEQELSDWLCNLEGEHKGIVARRLAIAEQLEKSKKILQKILGELEREQGNVVSLYSEYNELAHRMQEVTHECIAHRELLTDVRDRIVELSKVYIFVFEDGNIEVENAEMVSVSSEEVIAIFNVLVERPEAEEIKLKEIKSIARLKAMVKEYERRNLKFEINFGNPKAQQLFEGIL